MIDLLFFLYFYIKFFQIFVVIFFIAIIFDIYLTRIQLTVEENLLFFFAICLLNIFNFFCFSIDFKEL